MADCTGFSPAPLRCPTLIESQQATIASLPRGRAWPANDGGNTLHRLIAWLDGLSAAPVSWPIGFVQAGYFAALGAVRNFVETRLCALRLEFWCATISETRPEWMAEYGLPDACDPFPDLCLKVSAIGGSRCEYFNEIIARLGWRAECFERSAHCGARFGSGRFARRGDTFGGSNYVGLIIKVHTGEPNISPSIETRYRPARFGALRFGHRPSCDTIEHPSVAPIRCLMERIAPAHVEIQYVT